MSTLFKLMNARNDSGAEQQWEMLNLWKKKEERESSCIFRHIMICVCSLSSPPLPNQLSEWVKMWSDKLTLLPVDTRSWALCSLLLMFHFFFSTQNVNAVRICENREEKALWHVVNSHTAAHLCVRRRPTSRLTLDTTEDKTRYQTSHPKLSREREENEKNGKLISELRSNLRAYFDLTLIGAVAVVVVCWLVKPCLQSLLRCCSRSLFAVQWEESATYIWKQSPIYVCPLLHGVWVRRVGKIHKRHV